MKVTYYVEILSSWCHWAEPAWDALRAQFAEAGVKFDWRIALMDAEASPKSREECDWYYQRSGTIVRSPYMLSSAWLEPERKGEYLAPNLVAEAARDFGCHDDSLRRTLARAAMIDGRRIGRMEEAIAVAAEAAQLDPDALRKTAESDEVRKRVDASTREFRDHQLNQRPSFILENDIGDKVVFCGQWKAGPIAAAIEAMLDDAAGYAAHKAHFGDPPID